MLGDVRVPDPDISRKLVYTDPSITDLLEVPLLTAQIKYPYKDFVSITDVSGMAMLFQQQPTIYQAFHFDCHKLATLKRTAMSEDNVTSCTSFTALAAHVRRARRQALNMKAHQLTKLRVMVDFKSKFEMTTLPVGFFGNAVTTASCLYMAGELAERPIFTVGQIKNAVGSVTEDHARSRIDYEDVYKPQLSSVGTLVISSWTRLAFGVANFGWGAPAQFGSGGLVEELGLFLPEGERKKGIVVVLGLPISAIKTFQELVKVKSRNRELTRMDLYFAHS
ncbi:hypothetical protein NL676_017747 [Syzygium grande]|nr:hypothetical protein NL676_017747 [Syzygium grande]